MLPLHGGTSSTLGDLDPQEEIESREALGTPDAAPVNTRSDGLESQESGQERIRRALHRHRMRVSPVNFTAFPRVAEIIYTIDGSSAGPYRQGPESRGRTHGHSGGLDGYK
ncbi:hypothetical protein WME99_00700 [Sorangium sp. So ce136]|uniref:hypothetical protein n=1 Tax=Sorangium sp. So ce136 TaxID=3133284 RepID=UPI003F02D9A2